MWFRTPRVVVVGFFLCLMALARWGEAAAGSAPTWLTAPDTIPPERILWEGFAMPLKEVQRRAAIEEAQWLEAQLREAQLREVQLREAAEAAKPRAAKPRAAKPREAKPREAITRDTIFEAKQEQLRRREDLEARLREATERGHQVADAREIIGDSSARPLDPQSFPVVSIGQPEVWRLPDLYPLQHMPRPMQAQLQAADFYLIRLFCSFRPIPGWSRVGWARFYVFLRPDSLGRQPIAYDISPVGITQEVKRQLKFTLAPTLKFQAVVEAEVGKVEFGLEYPELQPIIVGAGIGEATPTWDYQTATGRDGIQGVKVMDLLVKAPKGMPAATAQLALTGQVYMDGRWIPIVGGPVKQGARLDAPLWAEPKIP